MRKLFFIIMVFCSFLYSEKISTDSIKMAASNFLNEKTSEIREVLSINESLDYSNIVIVNFTPSGFVVTSNDEQIVPILAYSSIGGIDYLNIPTYLKIKFSKYQDEINHSLNNNLVNSDSYYMWERLINDDNPASTSRNVEPLITAKWDQGYPFNGMCPSGPPGSSMGTAVVGCVAVGMGQLMHYWQHPPVGIGNHSYTHPNYGFLEADFGNTNYNFSNMLDLSGNYEVQQLLFHAGISVEMDYGTNGSGAAGGPFSPMDYPNAFSALQENFGYSNDMQWLSKEDYPSSVWLSLVKEELDNSRPIAYDACANVGCHFWNIDGYEDDYLHCNWGWGGQGDGFYIYTALGPDDEPIVFDDEEFMIIGISPVEMFIEGDINNDTVVNIQDIILIVNLILISEYNNQADLNSDNTVDILDIVQIINIILN